MGRGRSLSKRDRGPSRRALDDAGVRRPAALESAMRESLIASCSVRCGRGSRTHAPGLKRSLEIGPGSGRRIRPEAFPRAESAGRATPALSHVARRHRTRVDRRRTADRRAATRRSIRRRARATRHPSGIRPSHGSPRRHHTRAATRLVRGVGRARADRVPGPRAAEPAAAAFPTACDASPSCCDVLDTFRRDRANPPRIARQPMSSR